METKSQGKRPGGPWLAVLGVIAVALLALATVLTGKANPSPMAPSEVVSEAAPSAGLPPSAIPRPTPQRSLAPAKTASVPGSPGPLAPDFALPDLEGTTRTLSEFRGRPVLLFFWATW